MPRATTQLRASDRAKVLEVLEHADRPLTVSDISFRLRHQPYWARLRVALDALVADGTVEMAVMLFRGHSADGNEQRYRARGYTLSGPAPAAER